jgi:glycosyltransferase involved in cell wall biosynthesis
MNLLQKLRKPKVSLLHATRGRPEQALKARARWLEMAAHPGRVEHLFAMDCDDETTVAALAKLPHCVVPHKGGGCVAAWNLAAQNCTGDVLVQLSDDWTPVPGWDDEFVRRLRDVSQPGVLRPSDGHRRDDLLCMAILTRARLKQQGEFLHGGYFGIYSDDEYSFRAYQDGIVIDARDMVLLHDHPNYNPDVAMDETYLNQNSTERDKQGRKLFLSRNPRAKGHWLHEGDWQRFFIPLASGESWQSKPTAPPPRLKTQLREEVVRQRHAENAPAKEVAPRVVSDVPRIAIITRTVDRPVLLERTLRSVLAQTFADWQLVLVDMGKAAAVQKLLDQLSPEFAGRLKHVKFDDPKPGMRGVPINAGINASRSELIVLLDDDDTWEPDFLEKMEAALRLKPHPNARGAVCRTRGIEETSVKDGLKPTRSFPFNEDLCNITLGALAVVNRFPPCSFVFERDALSSVGLYPEDYPVLEDWHFNLRFVLQHDILVLPEMLANYHFRPADLLGAEANSLTGERHDHKYHESRLINEALREDIRSGKAGLGQVLAQAAISREISETLHRHEGRLKTISDKSGKIDSRTKELKEKLLNRR